MCKGIISYKNSFTFRNIEISTSRHFEGLCKVIFFLSKLFIYFSFFLLGSQLGATESHNEVVFHLNIVY